MTSALEQIIGSWTKLHENRLEINRLGNFYKTSTKIGKSNPNIRQFFI